MIVIVIVIVVVTGGKQSQLLASALGLGWSLTLKTQSCFTYYYVLNIICASSFDIFSEFG